MGHPQGESECVGEGLVGEMGKSAYKINVSVYFSDYMPFFIRDAGTGPYNKLLVVMYL